MKLFFEAYEYPIEMLREHLTPYLYHVGRTPGRGTVDYVGYFFNYDKENTENSDSVFILPKVFVNERNEPFDLKGMVPEDVVVLNAEDELLRENGISELVFNLSVWLYKAIELYHQRNCETKSVRDALIQNVVTSKGDDSETFLDIILHLISFHKKRKNLLTYITCINAGNNNKIHWARTISHEQPIIRNGKPSYVTFRSKEKIVNYDEELIVLFYSTLEFIRQKCRFKLIIDVNYNLLPIRKIQAMIEGRKGTRLLKSIRKKYFTDELVELWNLLYVFFDKSERIANKLYHEETLLVKDFQNVFEDMIDYLLSDEDYPEDLKSQNDGKIVDHLYRAESLIYNEDIYYVGDSKYYKPGEIIGMNSIAKQYTYAKNIIQRNINVWEGFNTKKDRSRKFYLPYRDERTNGYNITPNFFISGEVKRENDGYNISDEQLENVSDGILLNRHFKDRLFDRDTLILQRYNINFLYVLTSYAAQKESSRDSFRNATRKMFRDDLLKAITNHYNIYRVIIPADETIEEIVHNNYWELEGKVFSFGDTLIYATENHTIQDSVIVGSRKYEIDILRIRE